MKKSLENFIFTLRFFTRIPFFKKFGHSRKLADAALFFPLIGLLIGAILAASWFIFSQFLSPNLASGLTLFVGLMLTGALHEDGLADCADGLGGGYTKERILEIMRDSTIGVYGAASIVMSLILRWAALAEMEIFEGVVALLVAHMASRSAITIALAFSSYARKEGLASGVSDGIDRQKFIVILMLTLILAFGIGNIGAIVAVIIGLGLSSLFLVYLNKKLGGYTGDGLGAMQQICEITVLLVFASTFMN